MMAERTLRTPATADMAAARGWARPLAALAVIAVAAHLWMAWEHRAMPGEAVLMFLMAAACLPCAASVWRRSHDRGVQLLFGMSLVMVAVHVVLLLAPGAMAGHGHVHGGMGPVGALAAGGPLGAAMSGPASQAASMLGIIALELAVALLAAWTMRRGRVCP